jgi:hypothetical protein
VTGVQTCALPIYIEISFVPWEGGFSYTVIIDRDDMIVNIKVDTEFVQEVRDLIFAFIERNEEAIKEWCEEDGYGSYVGLADMNSQGFNLHIENFEKEGWSVQDAYKFMIRTEEIDPRLSEERAFELMALISNKYRKEN